MPSDSTQPFGVLLMAYGSPGSLDEVEGYYTHVRGGRAPSPEQLEAVRERYARIGGSTPLLAISQGQAEALAERLEADAPGRYRVYLGMRHWHPHLADTVRQMVADGISEAVGIVLAPHDSRISVGGYIEMVEQAISTLPSEPGQPALIRFRYVRTWHDEPHYLAGLAERVQAASEREFAPAEQQTLHVIFTAHSLPERVLQWQDPYPEELRRTATHVAGLLGLPAERWSFAYQSAGRTPEPWLGPEIRETITRLAKEGRRHLLICPVGFIADNLEILYDIDIECQDVAKELGVHLARIEMLNTSPHVIAALEAITLAATRDMQPAT